MSQENISGSGTKVTIVSTVTFPYGFTINSLSDDDIPINVENLEVAKYEMLLNGRMLPFGVAKPVIVELAVVPGSNDDANLSVLLSASRIRQQIVPIYDIIVMTINYPNGAVNIFSGGAMLSGPPAFSVMSNGRLRTNKYKFAFGIDAGIGNSAIASAASVGRLFL